MIGEKRYVRINEGAKRYSVSPHTFKTMTASAKILYAVLMEKQQKSVEMGWIDLWHILEKMENMQEYMQLEHFYVFLCNHLNQHFYKIGVA